MQPEAQLVPVQGATSAEDAADGPPLWPYIGAFVALAVLGLAFGRMAEEARQEQPDGLDLHAITWVQQHHRQWPTIERVAHWVTHVGDEDVAVPSTVAVALVLIVLGSQRVGQLRKREAVFWLTVAITSRVLCVMLKLFFQRERPPPSMRRIVIEDPDFSFPSGHSVYAAVVFSMLAILIVRALPERLGWLRNLLILACLILAILVGGSRVWLLAHYPSDVIGGLLLGIGWVIVAYTIRYGWGHWRWRQRIRSG